MLVPSGELYWLYWQLRAVRAFDQNRRRVLYRRISAEKKRLRELGVDPEEIRLLCRYLSNPHCKHAKSRFFAYGAQLRLDFGDEQFI